MLNTDKQRNDFERHYHNILLSKPVRRHLISILESVNLGDEVAFQEVDVFARVAVKVAVVVSTSGLAGLVKKYFVSLGLLELPND